MNARASQISMYGGKNAGFSGLLTELVLHFVCVAKADGRRACFCCPACLGGFQESLRAAVLTHYWGRNYQVKIVAIRVETGWNRVITISCSRVHFYCSYWMVGCTDRG